MQAVSQPTNTGGGEVEHIQFDPNFDGLCKLQSEMEDYALLRMVVV